MLTGQPPRRRPVSNILFSGKVLNSSQNSVDSHVSIIFKMSTFGTRPTMWKFSYWWRAYAAWKSFKKNFCCSRGKKKVHKWKFHFFSSPSQLEWYLSSYFFATPSQPVERYPQKLTSAPSCRGIGCHNQSKLSLKCKYALELWSKHLIFQEIIKYCSLPQTQPPGKFQTHLSKGPQAVTGFLGPFLPQYWAPRQTGLGGRGGKGGHQLVPGKLGPGAQLSTFWGRTVGPLG